MAEICIPITLDIKQEAAEFAAHVLTMWLNNDNNRIVNVTKGLDGKRKVILHTVEEVDTNVHPFDAER